jgi:hypothetical protein
LAPLADLAGEADFEGAEREPGFFLLVTRGGERLRNRLSDWL